MASVTWTPVTVSLDKLTPWERNPKRISKQHAQRLLELWDRLGQFQTIAIGPAGEVYDGHQRLSVLKAAHGPRFEVQALQADRALTEKEREELTVAAHVGTTGQFDWDALSGWDAGDLQAWGFDAELLGEWNAGAAALATMLEAEQQEGPGGDPGAALERAEALQEKYNVQRGQVWELGRHRVMCGDAYSEKDRQTILGDSSPSMLHIDPPYGINIVQPRNGATAAAIGGSKPFTGGTSGTQRKSGAAFRSARAERGHVQHGKPSKNQWAQSTEHLVIKGDTPALPTGTVGSANIVQSNLYPVIQGDDRPFDPIHFLGLAPIVIMWGANYFADKLPTSSCWIVWDKREDITRNTFADCELAWCNLAKPARLFHHLWNGLHKGSQHGEKRTHPTEKPTALFEEIGGMFCPSGVWLDVFAGTGAQIIAAERMPDVQCFAMEIEPLYVATILERWSVMTSDVPVLLENNSNGEQ